MELNRSSADYQKPDPSVQERPNDVQFVGIEPPSLSLFLAHCRSSSLAGPVSSAQIPRYLLRDRDRIFGDEFTKEVNAMGIKEVLSAPRSPWQRAYVERVIGTFAASASIT